MEKQEVTLQKVAEDLIGIMNQAIEDNFDRGMRGSTQAMRHLHINTANKEPMKSYSSIGGTTMLNDNWIFKILTALKNQHKIFDFRLSYGDIWIQA
jgi:hypothetical protein